MDITAWLGRLGLGQYAQSFVENHIDDENLASLTEDDLRELGVSSLGHRKKLLKAITEASSSAAPAIASAPSEAGSLEAGLDAAGPETYTPSHLAEQIRRSRHALEGERKQVTILFADIKGSTASIEGLDPEIADRRMEPLIRAMVDAVHRYEGTVNKVQGDGIMALFGAPLAHEDHAVRACCAAFTMQEAVGELNSPQQIRVGLHSGEVLVRSIGNDLSMDYDAIGHSVHLAGRMEQLAVPGTILMTADTFRAAQGFIDARSLGPTQVRGVSAPIELFELTALAANRTRWEARASRGLSRFVGREAEIATLERLAQSATKTQGWVVAIIGEAGLGKSRLLHEFFESPKLADWSIHRAGAVTHGRAITYFPVFQLLTGIFGIKERDTPEVAAAKVTDWIEALDPALEPIVPALFSVLELPVADPEWPHLDPPQRQRRVADAVKALALRMSERGPLMLVFEDLHWVDSCTQTVFDALVEGVGTSRLLLLATYRPEYQSGLGAQSFQSNWETKSYFSRVRLTPLEYDTAERMLSSLLGTDKSLDRLKRLLFWRTEGRPLFLEETVHMLAESRALEGSKGDYRLIMDVDQVEIPATVKAVLAARIDCLSPVHKDLLQIASVFRRDVTFGLLQAISDLSEDSLEQHLSDLQAFEYIFERQQFPEREYTFKHVLTREVAYESILLERRIALHRLLVNLLETHNLDQLEVFAERLAHHATRGQVWDKAVLYLRMAGLKTLERSNHRDAVEFFEEALKALDELPSYPNRVQLGIDLRLELVTALGPSDELERMVDTLHAALELADQCGDRKRIAAVNISLSNILNIKGGFEESIESGSRGLEIADELVDRGLQAGGAFVLGQAYMYHGEFKRAVVFLSRHIKWLYSDWRHERFGTTPATSVDCSTNLAIALAQLGHFDQAKAHAEEACRIGGETRSDFDLALGHSELGSVHLWQGELDEAINLLERAVHHCNKQDIRQIYPNLLNQLGYAYSLKGALAHARELLQDAVDRAEAMHLPFFGNWAQVNLSLALLQAGETAEASRLAEQALQRAGEYHYRWHQVLASRALGTILSTAGEEPARTVELFEEALRLATALEMAPEVAHCHLALGRHYQSLPSPLEARQSLTQAAESYQSLGMEYWEREARSQLALIPQETAS